MLADDVACNPRNGYPATVYANSGKQLDLYGSGVDSKMTGEDEAVGVEVDYRGYEVNVESFLRVLTGESRFVWRCLEGDFSCRLIEIRYPPDQVDMPSLFPHPSDC
jgi:hypothetical protein